MIEYFLVVCMFMYVEGDDNKFEMTGQPRVQCRQPLERRGPYQSEDACIKADQSLGRELGWDKRGVHYMALCDGTYQETSDAPEKRQQRRDSKREHQRTGPVRQAAGPSGGDSNERSRQIEEEA